MKTWHVRLVGAPSIVVEADEMIHDGAERIIYFNRFTLLGRKVTHTFSLYNIVGVILEVDDEEEESNE
jgi:hypothetical protein